MQKTFLHISDAVTHRTPSFRSRNPLAGTSLRLNPLAFPILRHARSFLAIGLLGFRESHLHTHGGHKRGAYDFGGTRARAPPDGFLLDQCQRGTDGHKRGVFA